MQENNMRYEITNLSKYHRRFEQNQWVRPSETKVVEVKRPIDEKMIRRWRAADLKIKALDDA
jgi:hypothetical protein